LTRVVQSRFGDLAWPVVFQLAGDRHAISEGAKHNSSCARRIGQTRRVLRRRLPNVSA
jgi:hypothetical protein